MNLYSNFGAHNSYEPRTAVYPTSTPAAITTTTAITTLWNIWREFTWRRTSLQPRLTCKSHTQWAIAKMASWQTILSLSARDVWIGIACGGGYFLDCHGIRNFDDENESSVPVCEWGTWSGRVSTKAFSCFNLLEMWNKRRWRGSKFGYGLKRVSIMILI